MSAINRITDPQRVQQVFFRPAIAKREQEGSRPKGATLVGDVSSQSRADRRRDHSGARRGWGPLTIAMLMSNTVKGRESLRRGAHLGRQIQAEANTTVVRS